MAHFLFAMIFLATVATSADVAISLVNGEATTVTCALKFTNTCVRDAESKGFVKLSDAAAGITVDWKSKPLRVVDVKGTAAEAAVRKAASTLEVLLRALPPYFVGLPRFPESDPYCHT